MLKSFKIFTCTNGSLGLHLSRAPWDPYPWVSSIQKDSTSYVAGLRVGDCLLEMNGNDVLGLKISDIAGLLKNHWLNESSNHVNVVIWRNKSKDTTVDASDVDADDDDEDEENNAHNINQQSLQKFATCLQHIAQLLECPVCLEEIDQTVKTYLRKIFHSPALKAAEKELLNCVPETFKGVIKPPGWQCCNGHVLCNNCRSRSEKCPVCRVPLGPRGRCLLSDKLFTLLAESFPCDGVRSNKNSPKDKRKCSTEFHNQPKMAIIVQKPNDDNAKAKNFKKTEQDFIIRSLRLGGTRRRMKSKKEETENGQQLQQQHNQSLQGVLNAIVEIKSDEENNSSSNSSIRNASQDYTNAKLMVTKEKLVAESGNRYSATSTLAKDELLDAHSGLQCHCRTCYKPTQRDAIVNNATVANKYIFHIQAEKHNSSFYHHQELQQNRGKYQIYQCPTGKLCCCLQQQKNVTPFNSQTVNSSNQMSNIFSTNGNTVCRLEKTLTSEWEILSHLTQDHQLAVNQYYADFGQRIAINHDVLLGNSVICLNIRGKKYQHHLTNNNNGVEKFFVTFVPLSEEDCQLYPQSNQTESFLSCPTTSNRIKVAVYIWHMNGLDDAHSATTAPISSRGNGSNNATTTSDIVDEVSNFDAIIENPKTGIKWFGQAHCLTTPWSRIHHKQHFFMHEVMEETMEETQAKDASDAFVIVIKEKS